MSRHLSDQPAAAGGGKSVDTSKVTRFWRHWWSCPSMRLNGSQGLGMPVSGLAPAPVAGVGARWVAERGQGSRAAGVVEPVVLHEPAADAVAKRMRSSPISTRSPAPAPGPTPGKLSMIGAAGWVRKRSCPAWSPNPADVLLLDEPRPWRTRMRCTVEAYRPRTGPMRAGPSSRPVRRRDTSASTVADVRGGARGGVRTGRLDRSCRPASPSVRNRRTRSWAVGNGMPISAAT